MMFNADVDGIDFALPPPPGGFHWHLAVDTSGSAPKDLFTAGEEPAVDQSKRWTLSARASAIFLTRKSEGNASH
jgi:glycogen operon protein